MVISLRAVFAIRARSGLGELAPSRLELSGREPASRSRSFLRADFSWADGDLVGLARAVHLLAKRHHQSSYGEKASARRKSARSIPGWLWRSERRLASPSPRRRAPASRSFMVD